MLFLLFSPPFHLLPLFIPRVYFLQRTDPFVYPPVPTMQRQRRPSPSPLRSSTLFFSNARFFFSMALRSDCFLSSVKDNKSHGTEKNRDSLRELNSLIGYWDIFLRSFFLRISIFRSFLFEEELIKYWTIFISIISVVGRNIIRKYFFE